MMYAPWFYCVFDGAIQCNHINISRYSYCVSHNTIKFGLGWVTLVKKNHGLGPFAVVLGWVGSKNMDPCPSLGSPIELYP